MSATIPIPTPAARAAPSAPGAIAQVYAAG
jgi:hypothetical protein